MTFSTFSLSRTAPSAEVVPENVAILMSTFNGEAFLAEQLDSLIAQTHPHWTIYASDDGSCDATLNILQDYRSRLGEERLVIVQGPHQGFAANFLSLLRRDDLRSRYFAFCDQDDCWNPDHLERGIAWLQSVANDLPALYCSRTRLIDVRGNSIGLSPLFCRPPSFENALVQSIAGGNTMLFNDATRELLRQTPSDEHIISHDWWAYLLVTGCGGVVTYESEPTVGYRQHEKNLVGSNAGVLERATRVRKMFQGTFRSWMDANLHALAHFRNRLTPRNRQTLQLFEEARAAGLARRLQLIRQSGVHRQSLSGTLGLAAAAILQRI